MPSDRSTTRRSRRRPATSRPKRPRRRTSSRRSRFRTETRTANVLVRRGRQLHLGPLLWPQVVAAFVSVAALAVLGFFGLSERFYVYTDNVRVNGAFYTSKEEVYQAAGVEGMQVFYLDPAVIARRVASLPYVKQAHVAVYLPAQVEITVVERQPVVAWVRGETTYWVDREGVLLPPRGNVPPPLKLVDPQGWASWTFDGEEVRFNPRVLQALLAWQAALPELREVYYDAALGLWATVRFRGQPVRVVWGDALVIEPRIEKLRQAWARMEATGQPFSLIDLSTPTEVIVRP